MVNLCCGMACRWYGLSLALPLPLPFLVALCASAFAHLCCSFCSSWRGIFSLFCGICFFAAAMFSTEVDTMCYIDVWLLCWCYVLHQHSAPHSMICAALAFGTVANTYAMAPLPRDAVALFNHAAASPLASSCSVCAGVSVIVAYFLLCFMKKIDLWHWWQSFVSACGHCREVQWQFWLVAASAAVVAFW